VWLDITRQTIAEKRLSIAAWKETLALLTMGLAHDFNNLMSGILSLTELMMAQLGSESPQTPTLNMVKQSSLQASQLIQRIVSLHRSKTGVRQYLDLNQVVPEMVELVCKVLPRRIRVETKLAEGQLPVYMDGVEFRQVVLNLALNAVDAMPDRGVLSFRVTAHTEIQELVHAEGRFPRLPCVCLSVQDNGTGISNRHMAHIFDPFFTTKPLTKGSGLGLYNARVFVEEHGGAISVDSAEGSGATFHLWLPQADFTEAERLAAQNAGRRRSVLLVGHPGLAIDAVTEFLRTHNFYVVATHTPARAVELLMTDENSLNGVMVLAEPSDETMLNLVVELHDRKLTVRVILQIVGGNPDQVDSRILERVQLVLGSSDEESVILKKLEGLFATDTTP
jgi:two-component system, cell cycle sensor histidine kinase and response regulator CckA